MYVEQLADIHSLMLLDNSFFKILAVNFLLSIY